MASKSDIVWFRDNFRAAIAPKIVGTPFTLNHLAALACQETGEVWPILRREGLPVAKILELCVGDTLDASAGRKAFPKTKSELVAHAHGQEMFEVARRALVDMAAYIPGYQKTAKNPKKFCHAFGIFQYDLQFLDVAPDYFLKKGYADFNIGLDRCLAELKRGLKKLKFQNKPSLTDYEMACVGIVYNTGSFNPAKKLKQGHFDGTLHYGEAYFNLLVLAAQTPDVLGPGLAPLLGPAAPPSPTSLVNTQSLTLRVRSDTSRGDNSNVIAELPDGHPVAVMSTAKKAGFLPITTTLQGASIEGVVMAKFLDDKKASAAKSLSAPPTPPEAIAPVKAGVVVRRRDPAGAQSLNEKNAPKRQGASPSEIVDSLADIIEWLSVDDPGHLRYAPTPAHTFCNIYAHDFCHLAGVYLPRVWWTGPALMRIAKGEKVDPKVGSTVDEQRANDLFRWLRDFGPQFGWQREVDLTALQTEVNQGAVGIIVARRKVEGASGHIVAVVPETKDHRAKRGPSGGVVAPLQSQAGRKNFQYGTSTVDWWKGEQFAEFAFWLHA